MCGLFELSRKDRVASGAYPPAFHGYRLQEMAHAAGPASLVRPAPGQEGCAYAFFPGCRLGGANPEYVTRAYAALAEKTGSAGVMLNCCGVPALWAGEETLFTAHIDRLRRDWEAIGKPTLVYACASCRRVLSRFLPEIPLVPLYELLEPAGTDGTPWAEAALFDPCAAAGMGELKEAVRTLAAGRGVFEPCARRPPVTPDASSRTGLPAGHTGCRSASHITGASAGPFPRRLPSAFRRGNTAARRG